MINIEREITFHQKIDHPNIIRFFDYHKNDQQKKVLIALEYAENGDLFNFLNKKGALKEEVASKFFVQTALALNYIHNFKMIHRDVKPENILLDQNLNAKLCDFGWSAEYDENTRRQTVCGTYEYMAPEILFKKQQDTGIDVWALGILLYELLHNKAPFSGRSLVEVSKKIASKSIDFSPKVSQDAKDLVLRILKLNPKERPTIPQILQSPFVIRTYGQIDESQYAFTESRDSQKSATSSNVQISNNGATPSSRTQTPSDRTPQQFTFTNMVLRPGTSGLNQTSFGGSSSSNLSTPMAINSKRPPLAPQATSQQNQLPSGQQTHSQKSTSQTSVQTPHSSSQSPLIQFNLGRSPTGLYQNTAGSAKSSFDRLPEGNELMKASPANQYQHREVGGKKETENQKPLDRYFFQPARDASQDRVKPQQQSYLTLNKENKQGAIYQEKVVSSHYLPQYVQKPSTIQLERSVLQPVENNSSNRLQTTQQDDSLSKQGQSAKLNSLRLKRVICDQSFSTLPMTSDYNNKSTGGVLPQAQGYSGQAGQIGITAGSPRYYQTGQVQGSQQQGSHQQGGQQYNFRCLTKQNSMDIDRSHVYEPPTVQPQFHKLLNNHTAGYLLKLPRSYKCLLGDSSFLQLDRTRPQER